MQLNRSTRAAVAAMTAALLASAATAGDITFSDSFDDGNAALRWTAPIVDSEFGTFDGVVDYAFDYSTAGIASAPNSTGGSTTGILMSANLTDQAGDEGESIGIIPTSLDALLPVGIGYTLSFDLYFNVDFNDSGSTEYAHFSVHTGPVNDINDQGLNDDVPFDFGISNGNGLALAITGEGGAFNDIHQYEDAGNANTGSQTGLGDYGNIPNGTIPDFDTTVGSGDPANKWLEVSIQRAGDTFSFNINGVSIYSETDASHTGGSFMLGYMDVFNSVGANHFAVYDNVQLSVVPAPTAAFGSILGLGALAMRRRR